MTPELWDRLKPLFDAAIEKTPADRQIFLATLGAEDEVRRELLDLVSAYDANAATQDQCREEFHAFAPGVLSALRPGDILAGRFKIVRWLGNGGMGTVYEAFDLELSEAIALKTIRPSIALHAGHLARFRKEVQLARRLSGPNVCRIYELFLAADNAGRESAFLTMELLEGVTLAEEIKRTGPLPWTRTRQITEEICAGLAAIHAAGIIHRDVKARNIMLAKRGGAVHAVLMDFGLAREVNPVNQQEQTALTIPGALLGTPASMAPEQFSNNALSPATDIYAVGIVLYEMLTGRAPFAAHDAVGAALLRAKAPVPPSSVRPSIPHICDRIVAKCIQFDPKLRYQSTDALRKDLSRSSSPIRRWTTGPVPRPVKWSGYALLGALLLAGSVKWWTASRTADPITPGALPWYEEGVAALREGSYMQAANELTRAVALDDQFVLSRARLAEAWSELDFTGRAEHEMLLATERTHGRRLRSLEQAYVDAIRATLTHDYAEAVRRQRAILSVLPRDQKAYGLVDLGRAQEKNNDVSGAIKSYEESAALRPDNPAPYVHLGILKSRQQDAAEAEAAFSRAEELYKVKQNIEGEGEVDFQRAYWANTRGDSKLARQWLEKCMQIARQIPSVQMEVRALTQLSNVEYFSEQDDKAIEDAAKAIQLARENGLEYWATDGLIRQANAYIDRHDWASAEKVTLQALEEADRDQHPRLSAVAEETLASIRDQQGRLDEQIDYAQKALKYFKEVGFQGQALESGIILQRGFLGKGEMPQALQLASEILDLAHKINSPARIAAAEETMGNTLLAMQQYPESLAHFQEALRLSRIAAQNVSYQLVHCAEVQWRLGRYKEAEDALHSVAAADALQPDIAVGIARARASMLLSQRRYRAALAQSIHARRAFKDLTSSDLLELGFVITVAEAETGRLTDAQQEAQALLDVAKRDGSGESSAEASYALSIVGLRAKAPASARQHAGDALVYFDAKEEKESAWLSQAVIAMSAQMTGDRVLSALDAKNALDKLNELQRNWGLPAIVQYRSRPDIQSVLKKLQSLIA